MYFECIVGCQIYTPGLVANMDMLVLNQLL
jgi:hypothetical protein